MIMGAIGFLGCIAVIFRDRSGSWALLIITTLSVALIGASVFNKLSLTKDGIIVETAQANLSALESVEKGLQLNVAAVQKLSERVDKLAQLTGQSGTGQTGNGTGNQAQTSAHEIDALIKENKTALDAITQSNQAVRSKVLELNRQMRIF